MGNSDECWVWELWEEEGCGVSGAVEFGWGNMRGEVEDELEGIGCGMRAGSRARGDL